MRHIGHREDWKQRCHELRCENIELEAKKQELEAENNELIEFVNYLKRAIKSIKDSGHNNDCIFCGIKDKIAYVTSRQALPEAEDAKERWAKNIDCLDASYEWEETDIWKDGKQLFKKLTQSPQDRVSQND